ncbi:hypothetical protein V500_01999 [Pseudogymnoascus sp. VKM F-4518 (FW-2643)]|nr:hypothetical protein V500_01999 [Pseudogymnoascus sp. VKM F-4518 (FW-2643)]
MSAVYGSLLSHVHAVVFFGVPHSGADIAIWGNFVARLLQLTPLPVNTNFIRAIQSNSTSFQDISRQFIQRGSELVIRTFFETKKIGNQLIVTRESASLNLPNELALAVPQADHRSLCRFSDIESQKYAPVRRAIRNLVDSSLSVSETAAFGLSLSTLQPAQQPSQGNEVVAPDQVEETPARTPESTNVPAIFSMVISGDAQLIKQLLDYVDRSQVNAVFLPLELGATPLHVAAIRGYAEIACVLLERGASPTALSNQGCTALHYAVNEGSVGVVDEILRRNDSGQLLYPMGDTINYSSALNKSPPLVHAASKGFTRIVQQMLDAGADPNVCGINRGNSLHVAAGGKSDDIVAALLQAGANPNNANTHGIIAIHVVNSAVSAEMLIEAGSNLSATIHSQNPYNYTVGATPLRVSVDFGNLKIVKVLAKHCTLEQIHMAAADGKSAIQAAFDPFKPQIARVLSDALEALESTEPIGEIE